MCGGGGIGGAISGIGKAIGGAVQGVVGAVKDVAKNPVFQMVAPIALNMMMPGLGVAASGALGLSAAWAPAIGGALIGGGMGALSGKGFAGAAKGALIGGVTSGVADYLANGTNPLSGMMSGTEGGAVSNPLTAGGTGSTNLTGSGSGLGLDKSTLSGQFGIDPGASSGTFGSINPNASAGSFNSITPPTSSLSSLAANAPSSSGGLSGFLDSAKGAVSKLIPDSTLGKVALGGVALSALNGMGSKPTQAAPPGTPPGQDPTMTQHLQQMKFDYNPINTVQNQFSASNYGLDTQTKFNPKTGQFEKLGAQNTNAPEANFFNNSYLGSTDPNASQGFVKAAAGGSIPSYAMGGLSQYSNYASGGMSDVGTDHGYLQGPGDGVSDDIPATIGGSQPARLAGGDKGRASRWGK